MAYKRILYRHLTDKEIRSYVASALEYKGKRFHEKLVLDTFEKTEFGWHVEGHVWTEGDKPPTLKETLNRIIGNIKEYLHGT